VKTPNVAKLLPLVCVFSARALAKQLAALTPQQALTVLGVLKWASTKDDLFEQARCLYEAGNAISAVSGATCLAKPGAKKGGAK